MGYAVGLAVFIAVFAVAWIVLDSLFSERRKVVRRLGQLSAYERSQASQVEPLLRPFGERVLRPVGSGLARGARLFSPSGYRNKLGLRMAAAGHPRGMSADRFLTAKALAVLGVVGFLLAVALVASSSIRATIVLLIIFVPAAFFLPDLWLSLVTTERKNLIRKALPDMLDMLTISVEAGLGFDAAIAKLIKNTSGPLSKEFGRMLQEIQAGVSRKDALKHLSERTDVSELNSFIMAMIQADVFGVSIGSVLRTQAKEMRVKRRQSAEERAQKAPVKIVFPLVLCILPATLIVVLGPAILSVGAAFGLLD
jgi:tight adherence protein C